MKVAVIIITFNGAKFINKCLDSLLVSSQTFDIIVVDNNSQDATLEILKSYSNVKVIKLQSNLGFGRANNIGIVAALNLKADYIMLINQDVYVDEHTVEDLLSIYREESFEGVLSPIHLDGEGTRLDLNFSNYLNQSQEFLRDAVKNAAYQKIYKVDFVNAAAWLISSDTLKTVGGFDPIFRHYGEDVNYCQRLLYHNYGIGIVPKVFIKHDRLFRDFREQILSTKSLEVFERKFKVRWANINEYDLSGIKKVKSNIIKSLIKSLLAMKFSDFCVNLNKLRIIKSCLPEIIRSREINITIGQHYLTKNLL